VNLRKYPFHVQREPITEPGETPLAYVTERSGVVREHRNRKKIALLHPTKLPSRGEHRIPDGRKGFGLINGEGMEINAGADDAPPRSLRNRTIDRDQISAFRYSRLRCEMNFTWIPFGQAAWHS